MKMNTTLKRISALTFAALMLAAFIPFILGEEVYAAKIRLNNRSLILGKGAKSSLKVKGTKKKVKWSSTKKSIATVSKKGVVKGKKIGTCYIKAKVAGKTLKCKVTVKKPAVANAMNLRNYILKKGKAGKGGSKYIRKKWQDEYNTYDMMIKAYKSKKDMYFKCHQIDDEGTVGDYIMNIDLISGKPGDVTIVIDNQDEAEKATYMGTVGYQFCYDPDGYKDEEVKLYRYEYGAGEKEEYTNPSDISEEIKAGFHMYTHAGFSRYDELFKKCKLKSRMKNLGFEYFK